MCYHKSLAKERKELEEYVGLRIADPENYQIRYHGNGFDHPLWVTRTLQEPQVLQHLTWGLIPGWCKDQEQAERMWNSTLNAKAETLFEKPSFKDSIFTRRCLIASTGFYEWMHQGKEKIPHLIWLKNEPVFFIGGVYDVWQNPDTGEVTRGYSVITTDANPLMARIHNSKKRMPFILPKELHGDWLQPNLTEAEIKELMEPLNEDFMTFKTVGKLISAKGAETNVPQVMEEKSYPEDTVQGSLF